MEVEHSCVVRRGMYVYSWDERKCSYQMLQ